MKNFNRGGGFGDKKSGGNFGRRDSGSRGGFGRDSSERPTMHRATCAECGNSCEVPFKPVSNKPVFCSNCFKGKDESSTRPSRGRDDRPNFGARGREERFGSDEKRMFEAVCSECGDACEVPFKPSSGKPVYCSECFGKSEGGSTKVSKSNNGGDQFAILNEKLDKILRALAACPSSSLKPKKEMAKEIIEEALEEVEDVVEETVAKSKKAVKKVAAKVEKVIKKVTAKKPAVKKAKK
ncbi:MAG: hypothetical protein NT165_00410 [Candidatus Falkowbacteria bacterium]|nr:hypothetical protein [Candidatus Falkowbacteria bacterium]